MTSYNHDQILHRLKTLDAWPESEEAHAHWLSGVPQRDLLQQIATEEEVILYAIGESTFIHSVLIPNAQLKPVNKDDLLVWSGNPYHSVGYVYGGGRKDVWLERSEHWLGGNSFVGAQQLIFARNFHGYADDRTRYELHQEFIHAESLFQLDEEHAYCKLNDEGDLDHVVSYTIKDRDASGMTLFTCRRSELERYMAVTDQSIVQMFDFTRVKRGSFSGWVNQSERSFKRLANFFYREAVGQSEASYTRGVAILRLRSSRQAVFDEFRSGGRRPPTEYAGFVSYDWRNKRVRTISTDPSDSTNYFAAKANDKPFELSPAFFKPEVLSKYRLDKDKYRIRDRDLVCRNAWTLEAFDVNDAGQVHAYIVYLRRLPISEQLHWKSYNEAPKGSGQGPIPFIRRRAFENHFLGQWTDDLDPIDQIRRRLRYWTNSQVVWWRQRDDDAMDHVIEPLTDSIDEWADTFLELSKLVIEGFEAKAIRAALTERKVSFASDEQSLALLERLIRKELELPKEHRLEGLRQVQELRSKGKPHAARDTIRQLGRDAKKKFGTYRRHFHAVCAIVDGDLANIQRAFKLAPDG